MHVIIGCRLLVAYSAEFEGAGNFAVWNLQFGNLETWIIAVDVGPHAGADAYNGHAGCYWWPIAYSLTVTAVVVLMGQDRVEQTKIAMSHRSTCCNNVEPQPAVSIPMPISIPMHIPCKLLLVTDCLYRGF